MSPVEQLLKDDRWTLVQVHHRDGPAFLRTAVLGSSAVLGYDRLLTVLWAYAAEGSGGMPNCQISDEMGRFETHLCDAVQCDAHAILTAVLTFDGARQWVFCTRDVSEFARRLSMIPDYHGAPHPIELTWV